MIFSMIHHFSTRTSQFLVKLPLAIPASPKLLIYHDTWETDSFKIPDVVGEFIAGCIEACPLGKYNNMFTIIFQSARGISKLLRQLPHQRPILPCSEPAGDFKSVELHQACFGFVCFPLPVFFFFFLEITLPLSGSGSPSVHIHEEPGLGQKCSPGSCRCGK